MDFLHAIFEDQLELRLEKGNAVIGGTIFPPVVILKADNAAYDSEYLDWLNFHWLPDQNELLERILKIRANRNRFYDLCKALKNGQVIPFVGSGMSVPSGLKTWSNFLLSIRGFSRMSDEELKRLLAESEFEEAAERLLQSMPPRLFNEQVEHSLRIDGSKKIDGAVRFLPELFDKLVLTTNLDDLLENLYNSSNRFDHIFAGNEIRKYRMTKTISKRVLIKLHGDCKDPEGRVLRKDEYNKAYAEGSQIREELINLLKTNSLLFLGCSLDKDRTVSLAAEIAKADPAMPRNYAFLQCPDNEDICLEREHFLTDCSIFPIWYQADHDECIQSLFTGMLQCLGKL
ncbi:MAG: SIR2 family protein [Methanothrix sp.]